MSNESMLKSWYRHTDAWFADFEEYVHRQGYARTLIALGGVFALVAGVSPIFGVAWAQWALVTISVLLAITFFFIAAGGTRRLRDEVNETKDRLLEHAAALQVLQPHNLDVKKWTHTATISPSGDAVICREIVLNAMAPTIPHHLTVRAIYYGDRNLSDRMKRQIKCTAARANADAPQVRTKIFHTETWTRSKKNWPMFEAHVFLGNYVQDGDIVRVQIEWPKYSAALRQGKEPEDFDVRFNFLLSAFKNVVVLEKARNPSPAVRAISGVHTTEWRGDDLVITMEGSAPDAGTYVGVTVDFTGI